MREFKFKKSYEEIKINEKVYRLDLADDKLTGYQSLFKKYYDKTQEMQKVDVAALDENESLEFINKSKEIVSVLLNAILGEGSFDVIYEESGRSLVNVSDLILYLMDVINERTNSVREDKHNQYLKNKQMINQKMVDKQNTNRSKHKRK